MNNQDLIRKLYNCVAACNYCADACLEESNVEQMVQCIRTDRECAAICEATARVMVQNSNQVGSDLLQVCMNICEACASECEKHDHDHCQKCAQACRECAEACRNNS